MIVRLPTGRHPALSEPGLEQVVGLIGFHANLHQGSAM